MKKQAKKQTRLSMKLLWKLYAKWHDTQNIRDFLEFVEQSLKDNR